MRSKPLLKPVVEALERQEAINRMLLDHINMLRNELGYEPISADALTSLIDGGAAPAYIEPGETMPIEPDTNTGTKTDEPITPPDTNAKRKYCESLMSTSDGLGMCCDTYDLTNDAAEYVFTDGGKTGEFYLNPAFASDLLKVGRRGEWLKIVKTDPSPIPDLPNDGAKYTMEIIRPGKTELKDDCWVIVEPAEIKINVAQAL